jgi:predicted ATPase
LVTSRAVLHLRGEKEFPVPPLSVPDLQRLPAPARLSQYAAAALFIQRALDVRPDFRMTSENAPAVAEICHRLDGLPLAIELAAARVRLLPPQALLRRLERRLDLLTGGSLDLPARQQTLRNTIAWSYDLLEEAEKTLFRRLSVFVGGCTLEAADAVCSADGNVGFGALDGIASLLDKSLLQRVEAGDGEPRIRMLETIREYATDQLIASGEAGAMLRRHAEFFLHAAEEWQSRFEEGRAYFHMEHDNFRAALEWSVESGEVDAGLRLSGALWWFWWGQGHWAEGRQRIEKLLAQEQGQRRTAARARALEAAGWLAKPAGDLTAARAFTEEALSIWHELGERFGVGSCQVALGQIAWNLDGPTAAQALFEAALATMREVGDLAWEAHCLANLGDLAAGSGNWERAEELYGECLNRYRELDSRSNVADALGKLGRIALSRGEYGRAAELYRESFAVYQKVPKPNKMFVGRYLVGLGQIAEVQGSFHRAVRLFGAASRIYEELWDNEEQMDQKLDAVREALSQEEFGAGWEEGRAMSLEQAIAHALGGDTWA